MNDWVEILVGNNANILSGFAFVSQQFVDKSYGIPLIRIRDLKKGYTEINYAGKFQERYIIVKNDILVGMDGEFHVVRWSGEESLLNQRVLKVVAKANLDNNLLYYFLIGEINKIQNQITGTTVKHLSNSDVENIKILVPKNIHEQSTIAKILTTVEQAIEMTEQLVAKYDKIKTGMMRNLLSRGIDENGNIRSEETHEFKDSVVGRVPHEWKVLPLKDLLKYISYGFTNPMPTTESGPYMVTAANIYNGAIQYVSCRFTSQSDFELLTSKSKPQLGDLLITKDGTLGRLAIVDRENLCINQSVAVLRVKEEYVDKNFLKKLLESYKYQKMILDDSGGSTIKHIYITKLDKMFITMPSSINEQNNIVEALNKIENYMVTLTKDLFKLKQFKTGLMQDLLTGKVRVDALMNQAAVTV